MGYDIKLMMQPKPAQVFLVIQIVYAMCAYKLRIMVDEKAIRAIMIDISLTSAVREGVATQTVMGTDFFTTKPDHVLTTTFTIANVVVII